MTGLLNSATGQLLLAFCAGAVSVLAFAPFGLAPLAIIGLALLFFLWRHPPRRGFNLWTGYAYGLGLMGFGVFWLRISIAQFGRAQPDRGTWNPRRTTAKRLGWAIEQRGDRRRLCAAPVTHGGRAVAAARVGHRHR